MNANKLDPTKKYLVSGASLQEMQRDLASIRGGGFLQAGPNVRIQKSGSAGGLVVSAIVPSVNAGVSSAGIELPFQVFVRTNPSNPLGTTFQARVSSKSDLLLSLQPNNNLAITGLTTYNMDGSVANSSWFNCIANDVIALYIVVSAGVATSATIQSYGAGTTTFDPDLAAWDPSDQSYVFDDGATPPSQIGINLLIAQTYAASTAPYGPVVVQGTINTLVMRSATIDNRPAVFPFPSPLRRYPITGP